MLRCMLQVPMPAQSAQQPANAEASESAGKQQAVCECDTESISQWNAAVEKALVSPEVLRLVQALNDSEGESCHTLHRACKGACLSVLQGTCYRQQVHADSLLVSCLCSRLWRFTGSACSEVSHGAVRACHAIEC